MKEHYQGLGHIAIYTKDMDGSIAFYEKIGGALRQRASIPTPDGDKLLALVSFGGFTLELIQSPTPMPLTEGNVPHFAVYVDDLDAAAAAVRAAGVDTFIEIGPGKTLTNLIAKIDPAAKAVPYTACLEGKQC